jgi:caffeoyl-CoA O-methyltransferase
VHCTEGDAANVSQGEAFLSRAGVGERVTWHVGDALGSFGEVEGEFDIVFVDINKDEYPRAWREAKERIRIGGLYIADNTIAAGSGNVLGRGPVADAQREHNRLISEDDRWISFINPTREGVLSALRIG